MPLLWLSLTFLFGLLLSAQSDLGSPGWALAAISAALLGLAARQLRSLPVLLPGLVRWFASRVPFCLLRFIVHGSGIWVHHKPPLPVFVLCAAIALGGLRYQMGRPDLHAPGFITAHILPGQEYVLEGIVSKPPDQRDSYTNLTVQVEELRPLAAGLFTPVEGMLLVQVSAHGSWEYGDRVRLLGELLVPPEGDAFSYREYLARQGIHAFMQPRRADRLLRGQGQLLLGWIYALRREALAMIFQLYPDPEASLLAGILLGVESQIPAEVQDAFRATGTSHIIAISGFNITILAGLFFLVAQRFSGRWWGAVLAMTGIGLYTILVGGGPAVVRAAIMGGLALFARQVGRRQDGINTLVFVAALMALADPDVLWDIGFQLSFMATLGLILYAEPLSHWFEAFSTRFTTPQRAARLAGPVGEFLLFTLAAQLTTLPVMAYHFRQVSLSSLAANPLILPVQPAVMVLGGLALVGGMIYQPLGQLAAYLAWPFVVFTIRVVEAIASMGSGVWHLGKVTAVVVVLFYALLFGWTFLGNRMGSWLEDRLPIQWGTQLQISLKWAAAVFVLLLVVNVSVWQRVLSAADGRLHLTILDVGSGDGLLVRSPTGRVVLVDGGPSASQLSDSLGRRLPLGERQLDALVVAAPGDDNLASLTNVLPRFPPEQVLWAGSTHGNRAARSLQAYFAEIGMRPVLAEDGQALQLGGGSSLRVLVVCPRGAVLLLEWENFRALLPVGIDFDTLQAIASDPELKHLTALLLPESGYAPANPPDWIASHNLQLVLLSVAADDWRGRPAPETLAAAAVYSLLRTDQNGWIQLSTDGEQLWVTVEQP